MKTDVYFLKEADLAAFLGRHDTPSLYGTIVRGQNTTYEKLDTSHLECVALSVLPPVESLKGFLFPVKEKVAVYPSGPSGETLSNEGNKQIIVGGRACDLAALAILDKVFLEGQTPEPFYAERRDQTIIMTTDCVKPADYCFCNLVGGKPYPDKGFDVNFSPVTGGYLVAVDSEKGQEILEKGQDLLNSPNSELISERDRHRSEALDQLRRQNAEFEPKVELTQAHMHRSIDKVVRDADSCVECGACSYICPTCHCFLLFDQRGRTDTGQFERQKTWDSCLMSNFSKMAGVGGVKPTPRPELRHRFENRMRHKFEWMLENLNVIGCVGCGRCESACMGGSDIRRIFKELEL